jgi:hypothetical protein
MVFKRVRSLFLIFFVCFGIAALTAQEENAESELPIESDWDGPLPSLYTRGDKTFNISLGPIFPVLFLDNNNEVYDSQISVGGTGALGFAYYLSPHFFTGGEVQFMLAGSLMSHFLTLTSFGAFGGYQFILGRFEIPLSLTIGLNSESFLAKYYLGLVVKPQAAAYFRYNSGWSFGLSTAWWWVPQWPKAGPEYHRYGNFLDVSLALRHHF